MDIWYVENWSLFLDLKIMLLTPRALSKKDWAFAKEDIEADSIVEVEKGLETESVGLRWPRHGARNKAETASGQDADENACSDSETHERGRQEHAKYRQERNAGPEAAQGHHGGVVGSDYSAPL